MVVAGIDVGSVRTKAVLMNGEHDILSFNILRSASVFRGITETAMVETLKLSGLQFDDIGYIISTAYGRARVPYRAF